MKKFVPGLFICISVIAGILTGCSSGSSDGGSAEKTAVNDSIKSLLDISGKYEGIIPCSNCKGIKMELLINPDSSFHLKETHVETPTGDSVYQKFGKVSPFNHFSKFMLKNRQDNQEIWIKPLDKNTLKFIGADGLDIAGDTSKLIAVSKVVAIYPDYKVTYKLALTAPEKSFVYSRNPKGDITIDKAWIDQTSPQEKSIIAWYAYLFTNGGKDGGSELSKALEIGASDEELLKSISSSFHVDSLKQKTGLDQDKTKTLGNLFCGKSGDKVNFNYTITDASGQAFSGNDNFGKGANGLVLERHVENKIQQFGPGNAPKPGSAPAPKK